MLDTRVEMRVSTGPDVWAEIGQARAILGKVEIHGLQVGRSYTLGFVHLSRRGIASARTTIAPIAAPDTLVATAAVAAVPGGPLDVDFSAATAAAAAAAASASSAATYAANAALAETNAETAETAAEAALTAADAAAAASAASATSAGSSATTASGAATTATTQAGNAATSASAAQTSAVSAQSVANRLLPERVSVATDFLAGAVHGAPDSATPLAAGSVVAVAGEGDVRQFVNTAQGVVTRGALPVGSGRTFRNQTRMRILVNGTTTEARTTFHAYDSAWALLGNVSLMTHDANFLAADGWQTFTNETTSAAILAAYPTAAWVRARATQTPSVNNTWEIAFLRFQDVTSEAAAAASATAAATSSSSAATSASGAASSASAAYTSATNAATSAGAASTSATNASNSATTSSGHAATASTQATNAANSATAAGGSATAAAGSATTASTAATNAGNSATAAASSAVTAQSVANRLMPSRPGNAADFAGASTGSPETATALGGTTVTDATEGSVREFSAGAAVYTRGVMPIVAGKTYRVTLRVRTTVDAGANPEFVSRMYWLDSTHAAMGSPASGLVVTHDTNALAADGWLTYTRDITANAILALQPAAVYLRPRMTGGFNAGGVSQGNTWRISILEVLDVTSEAAATASASAAATSASSASTSATNAGASATAASGSATTASTQASNASTSAGQASTSAGNAASSATTAGTHATNAAGSATTATTQASAAAASASAASASATLAATYSNAGESGLVNNSKFQAPLASGFPTGWTAWGGTGSQVSRIGSTGYAYRQAGGAGAAAGFSQVLPHASVTQGPYLLRATFRRTAGTLAGAGIYYVWYNAADGVIGDGSLNFSTEANVHGAITASPDGVTSYEKPITAPAGASKILIYAMTHWLGGGFGSVAVANQIDWHEVDLVSPGSEYARLSSAEASIVTNAAAIATANSAISTLTTTVYANFTALRSGGDSDSLPSTFEKDDLYFVNSNGGTFANVANIGRVFVASHGNVSIQTRGLMQLRPNRVYRCSARYRLTANVSNGTTCQPLTGILLYTHAGINTNGMWVGSFVTRTTADGWVTVTQDFTTAAILTLDATTTQIGAYCNPGWSPSGTTNSTEELQFLKLEDVTDIVTTNANVTTNAGAIAGIQGAAAFWETIVAAGGGDLAAVRLKAGAAGSYVELISTVLRLANVSNGAIIEVMRAVGGEAYFSRPISSDFGGKRVTIGPGFGVGGSQVVLWFGPDTLAPSAQSRTNGYFALGTDGVVYLGASDLASQTGAGSIANSVFTKTSTLAAFAVSGSTLTTVKTIDVNSVAAGTGVFKISKAALPIGAYSLSAGSSWNGNLIITQDTQAGGSETTILSVPVTITDTGGGLFDVSYSGSDFVDVVYATQAVSGNIRFRVKLQRTSGTNSITSGPAGGHFVIERMPG